MWFDSIYYLIVIFLPLPQLVYTPTDMVVLGNWTDTGIVFPYVHQDVVVPLYEVDLTRECQTIQTDICNLTDATIPSQAVLDNNEVKLERFSTFVEKGHSEPQFSSVFVSDVQIARVVRPWEHIVPERHVGQSAGLLLVVVTIFYWTFSKHILSSKGLRQLTARANRTHHKSCVKEQYLNWLAIQEQDRLQRERITVKTYAVNKQARSKDTTKTLMSTGTAITGKRTQSFCNVNKDCSVVNNRRKRRGKALKVAPLEKDYQQTYEKSLGAAANIEEQSHVQTNIQPKTIVRPKEDSLTAVNVKSWEGDLTPVEDQPEKGILTINDHSEKKIPTVNDHSEKKIPTVNDQPKKEIPTMNDHSEKKIPTVNNQPKKEIPTMNDHLEKNIPTVNDQPKKGHSNRRERPIREEHSNRE